MNLTKKRNESLKKRKTKITLACEQGHLYEATNTQGNHRQTFPEIAQVSILAGLCNPNSLTRHREHFC